MLTSLSLPPFNYLIINFLTFTSFFIFLIKKFNQNKNTKLFFIYGWLFVFGYFCSQIIKSSFLSKDRFSSLALIGFATVFLSHVFVNTAMTVGLIPVKGLPFPFVSAGGSFLVACYIMLGLVMKLSVNYSD